MARAWMKAALAGMAIMAMTAPVHAADTIKIGVPGAHSGDLVSYGMPSLNAARIVATNTTPRAAFSANRSKSSPKTTSASPNSAPTPPPRSFPKRRGRYGSICSRRDQGALPIYNDAKIVSISPSATTPELTQKGDHPYFFRTIASDDVSGHLAAPSPRTSSA